MAASTIAIPFKDVAILAKQNPKPHELVEGVALDRIVLVDKLKRFDTDSSRAYSSLPGHLIQLTVAGTAEHESQGRVFVVTPGIVAWFHEDEEMRIKVRKGPWIYFTVNFIARRLPPPPFDQRIRQTGKGTRRLFERLLAQWRDRQAPPLVRHLQIEARLLDLLSDVLPAESAPLYIDPVAQIWWALEARLREQLHEPVELSDLCRLSGRSARTLSRSCHRATGLAPLKRIKKIRLSMARGMVLHSSLNISDIAYKVGYDRVQELCRDYRIHMGCTPMEDRIAGPDYRRKHPRLYR